MAEAKGARVIANTRNEGYGRANNIGAAAADTPYVLIVNPDLELGAGAAEALLAAAGRYPDAGMLAPADRRAPGRIFLQPRSLLSPIASEPQRRYMIVPEWRCLPAVLLRRLSPLIRRELFLVLGGFDLGDLPVLRGRSLPADA